MATWPEADRLNAPGKRTATSLQAAEQSGEMKPE
jgi:hypothetical protein